MGKNNNDKSPKTIISDTKWGVIGKNEDKESFDIKDIKEAFMAGAKWMKIGINFSTQTKLIDDWKIVQMR